MNFTAYVFIRKKRSHVKPGATSNVTRVEESDELDDELDDIFNTIVESEPDVETESNVPL